MDGGALWRPLRWPGWVASRAVVGGATLWLANVVGAYLGFSLTVNPLTALVVGLLGFPGLLLVAALGAMLRLG